MSINIHYVDHLAVPLVVAHPHHLAVAHPLAVARPHPLAVARAHHHLAVARARLRLAAARARPRLVAAQARHPLAVARILHHRVVAQAHPRPVATRTLHHRVVTRIRRMVVYLVPAVHLAAARAHLVAHHPLAVARAHHHLAVTQARQQRIAVLLETTHLGGAAGVCGVLVQIVENREVGHEHIKTPYSIWQCNPAVDCCGPAGTERRARARNLRYTVPSMHAF